MGCDGWGYDDVLPYFICPAILYQVRGKQNQEFVKLGK